MKKFFTFVAAAIAALTVNADVVTFEKSEGSLDGKTYGTGDITLTVTDKNENPKAAVDDNSQYFGTATAQEQFKTRLKSGGKTDSKLAFKLKLAQPGKVTVYARSSSSSAARNVVFTQSGAELLKVVVDDSKAIKAIPEGETEEKSIFPIFSFDAAAGDVDITFDGGTNFYGFKLEAGEGPVEGKVFDFTKDTLNTVANIKALSDYTGTADGWALVDATSSDGKPYVKWNLTTAGAEAKVAFKNFPLTVSYTNTGTKNEFVKTYGTYFQVGGKGVVLTFDIEEGESVKLYPKSYGKSCEFEVTGATVEKVAVAKESEQVLAIKAAAGSKQIVLKANGGDNACQFTKMEIVAGEVGPLPIDTATITLKFINTLKWGEAINAYAWYGEGEGVVKNAEWPGVAAEKSTEQLCDFDVYKYSFKDSTYTKIIFNDGTNQTDDLEVLLENNGKIYDPAKKAWCTESEVKKNYIKNYYDDKNVIRFDEFKEKGAAVGPWSKNLDIYSPNEDYMITLVDGVEPAAYKMSVDANGCYFAKDPKSITEDNLETSAFCPAYRLKTGGKTSPSVGGDAESDPTNYIDGYCEQDMTLYIAARTGSSSDVTRTLIVKQFGTELYNKVLLESDAHKTEKHTVYPLIALNLKEGSFEITYPVGAIFIYGFLNEDVAEGIFNSEVEAVKAEKAIINGQFVIIKNGVHYTVMGARL